MALKTVLIKKLSDKRGLFQFKMVIFFSIITLIGIAVLIIKNVKSEKINVKENRELARQVAEEAIGAAFAKIAENPDSTGISINGLSRGVRFEVRINPAHGQTDINEIISIATIGEIQRKIICKYKVSLLGDGSKLPEKLPGGFIVY